MKNTQTSFKTLDECLAKVNPDRRARIIKAGDKLAAKRDMAAALKLSTESVDNTSDKTGFSVTGRGKNSENKK